MKQGRVWFRRGLGAILAAFCLLPSAVCHAQRAMPQAQVSGPREEIMKKVRLDQKLNAQVPLELPFRDEDGRPVRLGDYFGEKPVMLMLIQYRCTMLCTEQMNILMDSLRELQFTPGKEFTLLIVSIDPREQPDMGSDKKKYMLKEYGRQEAAAGLHFLTGDDSSITKLADAVGFHYFYDKRTDQYAHPDGVMILTPEGKIAKYFFGLNYPARDFRYGLIQAAKNRIGTPIDAIALLCFHYNPETGQYGVAYMNVLRLTGIATVVLTLLAILIMRLRERKPGPPAGGAALQGEG